MTTGGLRAVGRGCLNPRTGWSRRPLKSAAITDKDGCHLVIMLIRFSQCEPAVAIQNVSTCVDVGTTYLTNLVLFKSYIPYFGNKVVTVMYLNVKIKKKQTKLQPVWREGFVSDFISDCITA